MSPLESTTNRLSPRDREIVEHVVRDRISTNEAIQQRYFDSTHATNVTRTTARLCESGWLAAFPLIYPTKYFVPGKRAVSAYGLSADRCYPLGPQSLPAEYGLLEYTTSARGKVTRVYADEVQSLVPWYRPEWMVASHCKRLDGERETLELVRVDLGGPPDHIARKCRRDITQRRLAPEFAALVTDGSFSLVLITGSTAKAAAIQAALDHHLWPEGMTFRIAVFVSLITLLPRSL